MTGKLYRFRSASELPAIEGLPDPFLMADGSRVASKGDWERQRDYLKAMLAEYLYGHMPPKPDHPDVAMLSQRPILGGAAIEERWAIAMARGDRPLVLRAQVVRPSRSGRFPVVIKNDWRFTGLVPRAGVSPERVEQESAINVTLYAEAARRGYAIIQFIRTDLALDPLPAQVRENPSLREESRLRGVYPLYPEYDWGALAVWAWGFQVIIDALQDEAWWDAERIVSTGHSRGGKTALCAAIYDERIAIAAPNSSGTGGTGGFRLFEPGQKPQRIRDNVQSFPHWWSPRYAEFIECPERLPFDAHTMKALVAPRPLINPHGLADYWANPYGTQLTHQAAQRVYEWLGVPERIGLHWREGGHGQLVEDWLALLDFCDLHFFGVDSARRFDHLPYPDAVAPLSWSVPC
jgi:hypothetical protein